MLKTRDIRRKLQLQSFDDCVEYVLCHFFIETPVNTPIDKKYWKQYTKFLDGRVETQDLVSEFAKKLLKK